MKNPDMTTDELRQVLVDAGFKVTDVSQSERLFDVELEFGEGEMFTFQMLNAISQVLGTERINVGSTASKQGSSWTGRYGEDSVYLEIMR